MRMSIWRNLREPFDEKLPRRTAVIVKEDDWSLPFAYPCDFGGIGWNLDNRDETTYDEAPAAVMRFADYSFPDLSGRNLARNTFYFGRMEYYPGVVEREIVFSNIGIEAQELFARAPRGGWVWQILLESRNMSCYPLGRTLCTVVSLSRRATIRRREGVAECRIGDRTLHLSFDCDECGVYETSEECAEAMGRDRVGNRRGEGRHLVIAYRVRFDGPGERRSIALGASFHSAGRAIAACRARDARGAAERRWNAWFERLPVPRLTNERALRAYYKSWWTVRLNYYRHPKCGSSVLEALPVYRGFWQWALPAMEWHGSPNPEIGPSFVRRVLDLFLRHQRADGYVTHAIYLDEDPPGSRWGERNIVQTPHVPWVALRYYNLTRDIRSLRAWYPRLVRYHEYLSASRDRNFLDLHLWAIIASYDTGLDTTPAFQRVTYGEDGARERFCYPAIFAAERCRYERAMALMARHLGLDDEAERWRREAALTREAMDRILWDRRRSWYGVVHEDGSLDTRIGADGLFPFAYGLADPGRARAARRNFERLLAPLGVHSVAPGEPGYVAETYWRGPAWTKSCSLAMSAASRYWPDLKERVLDGLVNFLLRYPSVWECMDARTGKVARGDAGLMATPVISSNVGAGEAIGALRLYAGEDVFGFGDDAERPLQPTPARP